MNSPPPPGPPRAEARRETERRSPTGIARERETSAHDAAPCQREFRTASHPGWHDRLPLPRLRPGAARRRSLAVLPRPRTRRTFRPAHLGRPLLPRPLEQLGVPPHGGALPGPHARTHRRAVPGRHLSVGTARGRARRLRTDPGRRGSPGHHRHPGAFGLGARRADVRSPVPLRDPGPRALGDERPHRRLLARSPLRAHGSPLARFPRLRVPPRLQPAPARRGARGSRRPQAPGPPERDLPGGLFRAGRPGDPDELRRGLLRAPAGRDRRRGGERHRIREQPALRGGQVLQLHLHHLQPDHAAGERAVLPGASPGHPGDRRPLGGGRARLPERSRAPDGGRRPGANARERRGDLPPEPGAVRSRRETARLGRTGRPAAGRRGADRQAGGGGGAHASGGMPGAGAVPE